MQTQQVEQVPKIRSEWPGLPGSKYAGLAAGPDGKPDFHLVLLADKSARELKWGDAIAWAESIGAALPSRDESALLYAHLRDEFEAGWHWTGTQSSSDYAWYQDFYYGDQLTNNKKFEARARAVRRFDASVLQSFEQAAKSPAAEATTNALLRQILDQVTGQRADLNTIFLGDTGVPA